MPTFQRYAPPAKVQVGIEKRHLQRLAVFPDEGELEMHAVPLQLQGATRCISKVCAKQRHQIGTAYTSTEQLSRQRTSVDSASRLNMR